MNPPPAPVAVGRARELELIRDLLRHDDRRTGHRNDGALLLLGSAGIGKSLLLDIGARLAAEAGYAVLRASGAEFEAEVSFSVLNQALMPLVDELEQLNPMLRTTLTVALGLGSGPAPDRLVVGNAVLALLRKATDRRPLLLVVDDLQWADRPSSTVLGFLARRLSGTDVRFLAASRTGPGRFLEGARLAEHELVPLDVDAAGDLVDQRFPGLAAPVRSRLLDDAEGNPLALLELPTVLSAAQRQAREVLPSVLPLSSRLASEFTHRIAQLDPAGRLMLLMAALESTADLSTLELAGAGAALGGLTALSPAERIGLVRMDGATGRLTFRHPLIRSAVVSATTHDERRIAHRHLAQALSERPDQLERRARHLGAAAVEPDEDVASLLTRAAHLMTAKGDGLGAVAALVRAAELSPGRGNRSRRLAEAAYVGAYLTGERRGVADLLAGVRHDGRQDRQSHDQDGPDRVASLHVAAAAAYVLLVGDGDVATAHRLLVEALEQHGSPWDGEPALIDALTTLLQVCTQYGQADKWQPFHQAVERLRPSPPPDLHLMSKILTDPARTGTQALEQLDTAIEQVGAERDLLRVSRIAAMATYVDRGRGCQAVLRRIVDGSAGGSTGQALAARGQLLVALFHHGEWDEAAEHIEQGLAICRTNEYGLLRWPFRSFQALMAAARGDRQTTGEAVADLVEWASPRGAHGLLVDAYRATALAAAGAGDFETAYQQAALISPPGVLVSHVPHALWVCLALVEGAVRTERWSQARAHVSALQEAGVGRLSSRMALLVAGSAGLAAEDEHVVERFEAALALPQASAWPFDLARVRLYYGTRLRALDQPAAARVQLAAAQAGFAVLAAHPWTARAADELAAATLTAAPTALGVAAASTMHASGTASATASAGASGTSRLTPQERVVAELAAGGLTNKQIGAQLYLSNRTVGAHLARVFPKLGISSRAALRDALTRLKSGG